MIHPQATPAAAASASPAAVETDPMPQPPPWPDADACCGQGCDPCIFDLCAAARERYLADLASWRERQAHHPAPPTRETPP